jgi:hypothetical protein
MQEVITNGFQKATIYMKSNARPIEKALFEFTFENGPKERVLAELKRFQNEDGGFGHGIEPDFWLPLSSPMATWRAGQILVEIGADCNDELVQAMIDYLLNTFDKETGLWATVLPENNDYPHAPWWHWSEGVQDNWEFNPTAELAAFLVFWSDEGSEAAELGWATMLKAVEHAMAKEKMDKHQINNYQRLVQLMVPFVGPFNEKMPYSLQTVREHVENLAEQCMNKEVSTWKGSYLPLPIDFINHPQHALFEKYSSLVKANIELLLETMTDEGVWKITWEWGSYPEQFKIAKEQWKGILAIKHYQLLQKFGYLK